MTIGDVKSAFLVVEPGERLDGPIYVTTPKDYAVKGHRPERLFGVINGHCLGDQPQQRWRAFERFMVKVRHFDQHPMDPRAGLLRGR